MKTYTIAVGRSRTEVSWNNREINWSTLTDKLRYPRRTAETVAQYEAMPRDQKGKVKDVGGFVGGRLREDGSRRTAGSVTARSLVTLDIDFGGPDTIGVIRDALAGVRWCLYTTHSHTPEKPRYRLVVPLSKEITPDEYIPLSRKVAEDIGLDLFDDTTYEPHRLMYWPSCPSDGEFVFEEGPGEDLSPESVLDRYADWRNVSEWPVSSRVTKALQRRGSKQEDPTSKPGLIGAFCRTYSITRAMDTFLPGLYENIGENRYTYTKGSTAGGAIVYEDKWLYSHHGTDPCCGRLCNAFDLVRIHLYGDLDAGASPDTPVNRMPSFKAMSDAMEKDDSVRIRLMEERVGQARSDFDGVEAPAGSKDWKKALRTGRKGEVISNPHNISVILHNDPALKGCVRNNDLTGDTELTRDLPWRTMEDDPRWKDTDYTALTVYFSEHYDIQNQNQILNNLDLVADERHYHPIREYFNGLTWDGTPRLDTLLCDYLGADDSELTRAMTRKHFTAAVARIYEPGRKYDNVLTLIGAEGLGKSSLIRILAHDQWFSDSLTSIEGKEAMDALRGNIFIEMGELTNYKRSTSDAYKAFIAKDFDKFRPAYGRRTITVKRQCVFWASTNETAFLKGDTGNRRFWPVFCGAKKPTRNVWRDLPGEVDQIWAESIYRYNQHEPLILSPELSSMAKKRQEGVNEMSTDDRRGLIEEYLSRQLPATWDRMTSEERRGWLTTPSTGAEDIGSVLHERETVCAIEILVECFGMKLDEKTRYRTKEIVQILRSLPYLEPVEGTRRVPIYGPQRVFKKVGGNNTVTTDETIW